MNATLAKPGGDAIGVSQQLIDLIIERIQASGPLSFYDYMHTVLYEPQLGYYVNGCRKFGAEGDYITAAELSALFGCCIARHIQGVLAQCQQPVVMELGAGSGILASQILLALEAQQALPHTYYILDVSGELQQRQRDLLARRCEHLLERVMWLKHLPDTPFEGVIFGNEVIDAMPVHRFGWHENQLIEMGVDYHHDRLVWHALEQPDERVRQALLDIDPQLRSQWPQGYRSEVRPQMRAWLRSLSACLHKGMMLWIDYGHNQADYYHAQHSDGTLMCYYRHHGHSDPFVYPGLQDITAHVDFTQLAVAAQHADLALLCYTTQAQFLLAADLERFYQAAVAQQPDQAAATALHMRRLIMPDQMGERFKVMVLGKQLECVAAYAAFDQRYRL
jgi:SAM-dependent MidA family methyltransferase